MSLKSKIIWVGALLISTAFASEVPPPDASYKHNVLPNGLTYYVKKNAFPENRASLRLYVKAGSIHEEDDQQGLAHFLEHMLFRGSENFADWEVINFLESIGAQFGPDTNAYTSFDCTCYMLELPLEKEGVLEKAFHICSDWASKATISSELVEKERAVVCDELNMSLKSAGARQFRKIFDIFLPESRYSLRWPIGKKDVVLNCDPQRIRDFYKKWYRPDRMAVVAVGDFDEDEVEAYIVKYFSAMENPEEELQEPDTSLNYLDDSQFEVLQDDEQNINFGIFWTFVDNFEDDEAEGLEITREGMKKSAFKSIFTRVLAQRLDLQVKNHPAPFVAHFPMNLDISRIGIRGLAFCFFEDRPYFGMKSILTEMKRLFTFGPSQHEFDDIVVALRHETEEAIANTHRTTHAQLASNFIEHFQSDVAVYKEEDRLNYKLSLFDELSRDELKTWLEENDFDPFKHIVFQVKDENLISRDKIVATVEEWLNEEVIDSAPEMQEEFVAGHTKAENVEYTKSFDEKLGYTTLVLENGMKVILQPSDLEKKAVTVALTAKGGKSLLNDEQLPSADYAPHYIMEAGLGNLAGQQFDTFLKKKNISMYCSIGLNQRSVLISGLNDDIETLVSLSKAVFNSRNRDAGTWNNLIERWSEMYKNLESDPYHFFSKFVGEHYHKKHPMYINHVPSGANEESAAQVNDLLFSDPSPFDMVVIGDFNESDVIAQIVDLFESEKSDVTLACREDLNSPELEKEDVTIYRGQDSHCKNYIFFGKEFKYEHIDDVGMTQFACDHIITHRLLKKMRKEMGDTYGMHLSSHFPSAPSKDQMLTTIYFGCEPVKADNLKKIVLKEIEAFLENGVTDDEINTAKEILLERERVALLSNQRMLGNHIASLLYGVDVHDLADYRAKVNRQVTKDRLESFAKASFGDKRYPVSYTIKPESHQE